MRDHQNHHRLEDAGKNRMEAEDQDTKESGNDKSKADKPYCPVC